MEQLQQPLLLHNSLKMPPENNWILNSNHKDMLEHMAVHSLRLSVQSTDKNYSALLLLSRCCPLCSLNNIESFCCVLIELCLSPMSSFMIIPRTRMFSGSRLWWDASSHPRNRGRVWEWHLYPACLSDLGPGGFSLYMNKMWRVSSSTQGSQAAIIKITKCHSRQTKKLNSKPQICENSLHHQKN